MEEEKNEKKDNRENAACEKGQDADNMEVDDCTIVKDKNNIILITNEND